MTPEQLLMDTKCPRCNKPKSIHPNGNLCEIASSYVGVMVDGELLTWRGSNPSDRMIARQRVECYRSVGHTAYAVEINAIKY